MAKPYVALRLDDDLKEALKSMADDNRRSMTSELARLVEDAAKAKGKLPPDWRPTKRGS